MNLIQQLITISGRLPKTLTLPVENIQEEIKDIYKLIYVKARVTGSFFMYELHIPLASDEDFVLYQNIALPMKNPHNGNEKIIVRVSSKYIAVNLEKNTYVQMNDKELNRCIQRSIDNFVCIMNLPIYNLQNAHAPCEAKLLSHQMSLPCIAKKTECETAWVELHNTNSWLAICCDSCTLRTVCDSDVKSHVINTSSIVSLKQGCLLRTKDLKIHSHNNYNSNARLDYDIQIPTLEKTINSIVNKHSTSQLNIVHNEDIAVVEQKVQYMKSKEQLPATLTTHDVHHYAISYLLVAACTVYVHVYMY